MNFLTIVSVVVMVVYGVHGSSNKECSFDSKQQSYRGNLSKTINGRTCQRWDSQTPNRHGVTPTKYPDAGIEGNNYCRNPDGEKQAWCYTVDGGRWGYCDVPRCDSEWKCGEPAIENGEALQTGPATFTATCDEDFTLAGQAEITCTEKGLSSFKYFQTSTLPVCNVKMFDGKSNKECSYDTKQMTYRGDISTTEDGRTCQAWNVQTPNKHWNTPRRYPNTGIDEGNYCRNPSGEKQAWCYTVDGGRWDWCKVPHCASAMTGDCVNKPTVQGATVIQSSADTYTATCSGRYSMKAGDSAEITCADGKLSTFPTCLGKCRLPWRVQDGAFSPSGGALGMISTGESVTLTCNEGFALVSRDDGFPIKDPNMAIQTCNNRKLSGSTPRCTEIPAGPCSDGQQKNYRGEINKTFNGTACLNWDTTSYTPDKYPDSGLEENYCRNPTSEAHAWCFTDTNGGWAHCKVRRCTSEADETSTCKDTHAWCMTTAWMCWCPRVRRGCMHTCKGCTRQTEAEKAGTAGVCNDAYGKCADVKAMCKTGKWGDGTSIWKNCLKTCDCCGGKCEAEEAAKVKACGEQVTSPDMSFFKKDSLDKHNELRALHKDTPAMTWDTTLQGYAQTHSNWMAANNAFKHSSSASRGGAGENLYMASTLFDKVCSRSGAEATQAWYDEIKDWIFSTSKSNGGVTGHFTQVVWTDSTKVGCAYAFNADRSTIYVTCTYDPTGNFNNLYSTKVTGLKSSSQLEKRGGDDGPAEKPAGYDDDVEE